MEYYRFFLLIDSSFYVFLIIIGLFLYKRIERKYQSFFIYFFIAGLLQMTAHVLARMQTNNHFIMPLLICAEIFGLGYFYYQFQKSKRFKNLTMSILGIIFLILLFEIAYGFIQHSLSLLWFAYFFSNVFFALLSFSTLLKQITEIEERPEISLHIGVFLFTSVSALVFLFASILQNIVFEAQLAIWYIHTLVHFVFLLLVAFSLWKKVRY